MRTVLGLTKALADEPRIRILSLLRTGELCVCQIVAVLGLATSTVSKHLSILSGAGLVESRKAGRWAYYRRPGRTAPTAIRDLLRWLDRALAEDTTARQDTRRIAPRPDCPADARATERVKNATTSAFKMTKGNKP